MKRRKAKKRSNAYDRAYHLSVDSGGTGAGWALWPISQWGECLPPERVGVINPPSVLKSFDRKADYVIQTFEDLFSLKLDGVEVDTVWSEFPIFIPTAGGRASATRGDVFKLAEFCGRLHQSSTRWAREFNHVSVREWKGQMSKRAVNNRLISLLGKDALDYAGLSKNESHDWDATGIGLWAKGHFD